MSRKTVFALVALLAVLGFLLFAWGRLTHQDEGLVPAEIRVSSADSTVAPEFSGGPGTGLEGRLLVWYTIANVPLEITVGGEGSGLLKILGVPRFLRPRDIPIGRKPIRDEWNIATLRLGSGLRGQVRYLTESNGTWTQANPTADGRWVFATRTENGSEDIGRINVETGVLEPIAFSYSLDRMPSASRDGSRVLFHSFRDHNAGGDLYLATQGSTDTGEWIVTRLTDAPTAEYAWPRMAADGGACIAVERAIGSKNGRVVFWRMNDDRLLEPRYLTEEIGPVKFPSLDSSGSLACWQMRQGSRQTLVLWSDFEGIRQLEIPPSEGDAPFDLVQPSITPDGRFVTFIEDHLEPGADKIGIYDIENQAVVYFTGCDGNVMYPTMSDPASEEK
jgi:hypothetical protein